MVDVQSEEELFAQIAPTSRSAVRTDKVTGGHLFTVYDYSLSKGIGNSNFLQSDVFIVDGYEWIILFYPQGSNQHSKDYISFFLRLKNDGTVVKAKFQFSLLKWNGANFRTRSSSQVRSFGSNSANNSVDWGFSKFIRITQFEGSRCLKDDSFSVWCTVTVVKGIRWDASLPCSITIQPSEMKQNMTSLLDSGDGADVIFEVEGERFKAHRWMLAARSTVFKGELFGGMKENRTEIIAVDDIKAPVFRSMLHFIYADSLPDFEERIGDDGEKHDPVFMAQHLLVAADIYGLERLKSMCEAMLWTNLDVDTAATTIVLAEQHNCTELKARCLKFMRSPVIFQAVAKTEGFVDLMKICPSILMDV